MQLMKWVKCIDCDGKGFHTAGRKKTGRGGGIKPRGPQPTIKTWCTTCQRKGKVLQKS